MKFPASTNVALEPSFLEFILTTTFFKEKAGNPTSYINKMKHTSLRDIEKTITEYFSVQTEYFLGIKDKGIFESQNPDLASLYVIKGRMGNPG